MTTNTETRNPLNNAIEMGYGIGEIQDMLKRGTVTMEDLAILGPRTEWPEGAASSEFAELIPFEQSEAFPDFPLNALPPVSREFIHAAAETVQAPVDMVGSCVLGMLEVACRGRYPVRLPNGHTERACMYIAPIAPPSERKSGVTDLVARPLNDYEIEFNREHGGEVAQNRSALRLLQGRIASAEQAAIKARKADERIVAEQELRELNNELAEFEVIEPLRLFGADVTPEKLAHMLKSQGEVFALVSAEGGGLFENIGRYSDKGGLEIYLNGYSGDRASVDRKSSDSIILEHPTLSIIAPCQPSVIADLFSDKQKSGRGLLSRILFVKCSSRVGSRKATSIPLSERITANYRNHCFAMLGTESSGSLAYDSGGFGVYATFFDEIEPLLTPDVGELEFMADWAGKIHGNMTRFAGLIHCINAFEQGKDPLDTPINADEAHAAVELARFYLAHAKAVYGEQAEPETLSNARYVWNRLITLNAPVITKTQIRKAVDNKKQFKEYPALLDESLNILVERGYIRLESRATSGRPSTAVFINELAKMGVKRVISSQPNTFYPYYPQSVNAPNAEKHGDPAKPRWEVTSQLDYVDHLDPVKKDRQVTTLPPLSSENTIYRGRI